MKNEKLIDTLSRPFRPDEVHFRAQGGSIMAYTDARAVRARLTVAVGTDWSTKMVPLDTGDMICELTVAGVTRADAGEADAWGGTSSKAAASDALKRAAFSHGIGEYLYSLPDWHMDDGPMPGDKRAFQRYWQARYAQWLQTEGVIDHGQPVGLEMQLEGSKKDLEDNPSYLQLRAEIKQLIKNGDMSIDDVYDIIDALRLPPEMIAWNSRSRGKFYEVLQGVLEAQVDAVADDQEAMVTDE